MHLMSEWKERCRDQDRCWLVLRLEKCKIVWAALEGDIITHVGGSAVHWSKVQDRACCWSDREHAYQQARALGGLLYQYDR